MVVNPLSVVVQASGKKRLILDLSTINGFIRQQHFKMEDYRVALPFLNTAEFCFCFDFQSAFHHILMHPDSVRYLGFSWEFNGQCEWFYFLVLCFGLCTAPFVFTKMLKPLIGRWRAEGIKLILYLDDGLGLADSYEEAKKHAGRVRQDLKLAGFCINDKKSVWAPTKKLTFLGFEINLGARSLATPEIKRQETLQLAQAVISQRHASARKLAKLAGKIISMHTVLGDIALIGTKRLWKQIDSNLGPSQHWDWSCPLASSVKEEIAFWLRNLIKPEIVRILKPELAPSYVVFFGCQ